MSMIEQMTEELDNDELLRMRALEMAFDWGKEFDHKDIVECAQAFYNFLKGNVSRENVQIANH